MPNILAPFGFQFLGLIHGAPGNFSPESMLIQNNYATPIGQGDAVTMDTGGYITRVASGTNLMAGIFVGARWFSVSFGRTVWRNYWPGTTDAVGDIEAYVIAHPDAMFRVQMDGAANVRANVSSNFAYTNATPNPTTGLSTMTLTSGSQAATGTLPFKMYDLYSRYGSPGDNGIDDSSANNHVIVIANFWNFKSQTGNA